MIVNIKKKTQFKEIFSEFPHILERESIFTKGVEVYKAVVDGKIVNEDFNLGEAKPSWDNNHPDWLDEDDWTDASDSESEDEKPQGPRKRKKASRKKNKKIIKEKLSLTKEELEIIKQDPEGMETAIAGSGNELIDYVAKELLFMVVRFRKIVNIRVGKRIRKIHRVSVCNDFANLSTKVNNPADFLNHALDGLHQLVKMESDYFHLKKKTPDFCSWRIVRGQCRNLREKLIPKFKEQEKKKIEIRNLLQEVGNLSSKGKLTTAENKRLKTLERNCWWQLKNEKWYLKQLEVIGWIRCTPEAWKGNEAYVRLLSRSALRRPAQTHVESLISIIGNHNRGQDWEKILTEIQFRSIGPSFHECGPLVDQLIRLLRKNTSIRALLKRPETRLRRNPEMSISRVVDRQMAERSIFEGLKCFTDLL